MEDFECPLPKVEPLEEWFGQEDEKVCRPCRLKPLASFYMGELQQAGETALAEKLQASFQDGDILTIAKTMDTIKAKVGEDTRLILEKLDCFSQSFKDTQEA